ncbi:MAG: SUMF1/EgtB/PvdO family nonheme iron enzyme [Odoribacter sp.]
MKSRLTLLMILIGFCLMQAEANNVRITDKVKVVGRLGKDTVMLSFPLQWDNSWKVGENWDAVYLFIKYRRIDVEEPWRHLCIKQNGHRVDPGYSYSVANTGEQGVGLFVYRNTTGAGQASTMVRLLVDINEGDLRPFYQATYDDFKSGKIDISVAAIEMVFVPRGLFYIGDGFSTNAFSSESNTPYLVENEKAQSCRVRWGNQQDLQKNPVELKRLYPKGYEGFYGMKYEISQEQYVYFLNKLPYGEQKKRIRNDLDKLSIGQYAFEENNNLPPAARNGIILEKRKTKGANSIGNHGDTAVIFGHNLNQDDGIYNSSRDGKTIACNYLTPEDAKVYADWVGLRLMTELEYEKACRMRNPDAMPTGFQYAWNGQSLNYARGGVVTGTGGTVQEIMAGTANVNANKGYTAPVRCGSFARENTTFMSNTGATYWGMLDMTGNLSEMCCNAIEGNKMVGIGGDGSLLSEVISWSNDTVLNWYGSVSVPPYSHSVVVHRSKSTPFRDRWGATVMLQDSFYISTTFQKTSYSEYYDVNRSVTLPVRAWPDTLAAYGLRGGSYASTDKGELAVSGRLKYNFFAVPQMAPEKIELVRSPEVTFRLVRTAPFLTIKAGRIGLQNNEFRDTAVLCSAVPYVVKELDTGSGEDASILYEWEEDQGSGWLPLVGKCDRTLSLTEHWNTTTKMASRKYRRKSTTSMGEGYSNEVSLTLLGVPNFLPLQATIDGCDKMTSLVGRVETPVDSMLWERVDKNVAIGSMTVKVDTAEYTPNRIEFPQAGNYEIRCNAYLGGCPVQGIAYVNVDAVYAADDCPAIVTDVDESGQTITYHGMKMPDCRCWLKEPVMKKTMFSQQDPGGSSVQMYDFNDLASELSSENTVGGASNLCPPGFYVPIMGEVDALISGLAGTKVADGFKGLPLGFQTSYLFPVPGKYYWPVIYKDNNSINYQYAIWLMTISGDGKLQKTDKVPDPDYPDTQVVPASGDMFFPVRCIKAKPIK